MSDTVTIPRTEYERLLEVAEDARDIVAANRVTARIAGGEDEWVPAQFANRILDGESPVAVYRELRGLSRDELSRRSGIDASAIVALENGAEGSLATFRRLANALGVSIDDLVSHDPDRG